MSIGQGMWRSPAKLNTISETVAGIEPPWCVRGPELRHRRMRGLWGRFVRARCGVQSLARANEMLSMADMGLVQV